MACPQGTIYRKSYTRKSGTSVKATCVRGVSRSRPNMRNMSRTNMSRKVCPPGQIARSGYIRGYSSLVRKRGFTRKTKTGYITVHPKKQITRVHSTCVKDPKSTPRIGPLKQGELKKYGYRYKLPEPARRAALQRAISHKGALDTYRKLNAVAKLSTSVAPKASKVFSADRNWIRRTYSTNGKLHAF